MFVPLYDGVPLKFVRHPFANWSLIGLETAIWLATAIGLLGNQARLDLALGVIPSVLFGKAVLAPGLSLVPAPWTLLTSLFVHAGFLHLAGNMIFLWVFGDNVEDAMGALRYAVFFLVCGVAGALAYSFAGPTLQSPLIGASGAISGVVIAYLMLYPRAGVFGLLFFWLPIRVPAVYIVGAWALFQIGSALWGGEAGIGWWAHVGGLAAGAALTPLMRRSGVPLFGARRVRSSTRQSPTQSRDS